MARAVRSKSTDSKSSDPFSFLGEGGEMRSLIRSVDWANTAIGPVEGWSDTLRTTLRIILASRFPHILWWGPEYVQFYNDAYIPIPGVKHPRDWRERRASRRCAT
jgi:hypothetical protein